ncbi:TIGR03085 family metal-binding protein [Tessaracoccus palaemonis]|uniref:TIGR03085 family protein n=1 Tax=Tessaracoccus palaemonis TaxID=2829499 RepID=A0ABX8SL45_9ACTN|nr:TIGR03085 family metal-binding protein [Tessaracoccus palaemonis]QXT64101.1 TIGR03085 family protein [Tessaracoccus palaemonis]
MTLARRQRAALADLLEELGPFAPTECAGWQTQDLAAHLYVREHKLGALPGIGSEKFAPKTERIQRETLHELGYPALVEAIRTPGWIMFPVDNLVNSGEYFMHHEDVLRANGRVQVLKPGEQRDLWPMTKVLARKTNMQFKGHVRLQRTDTGEVAQLGRGPKPLTIAGLPSEILLHLSGRKADVAITGEPAVVEAWQKAIKGL